MEKMLWIMSILVEKHPLEAFNTGRATRQPYCKLRSNF
jgi:hypothetical protein